MGKEIGIDFGTTNTVVSYFNKKGKLRQLKYKGDEIIPSAIYFYSKNEYVIGSLAKRLIIFDNQKQAGVLNFKPKIGEKEKIIVIAENGDTFSIRPREVARLFLNEIVHGIEEKLIKEFGPIEGCIDKTVITVPAKFNSTDKAAIKKAAKDAGFKTAKLVAEPTAAAVACQEDMGLDEGDIQDKAILVYDFGGGTFDVSIIRKEGNKFQEIATNGDKNLGGNTLTDRLAEELLNRINDEYGMELPFSEDEFDESYYTMPLIHYRQNMLAIWQAADVIKEELSESAEARKVCNIWLDDGTSAMYEAEFSRNELERYISRDVQRTIDITIRTIEEAREMGVENISPIVLAGGSSNIPFVKKSLEDKLVKDEIIYGDDVSTLISRGATILAECDLADELHDGKTNVQTGIAVTSGVQYGKFQAIIPENEPLPCSKTRRFKLMHDRQQRLEIHLYECDVKNFPKAVRIDDNGITLIDTLIIDDLPAGLQKDNTVIDVEITIQKDDTLAAVATVKDGTGNTIQSGSVSVKKESDLE